MTLLGFPAGLDGKLVTHCLFYRPCKGVYGMCEVQNEVQNASENVNKDKEPEILYHYCSLETFYNIIMNKSIWLSDLSKTNDSQELIWLKETVSELLLKDINSKKECDSEESDSWEATKQLLEHAYFETSCWGFCLSEKGDNLGQWRGYGDDGLGISIGFKFDKLSGYDKPSECIQPQGLEIPLEAKLSFDKVYYGTKTGILEKIYQDAENKIKQKSFLHRYIEDRFNDLRRKEKTAKNHSDVKFTNEQIKMIVAESLSLKKGPFYKMSGFKEEKEYRIVFSLSKSFGKKAKPLPQTYGWPEGLKCKGYKYHIRNHMLVSHFEIEFGKLDDVIASITIGPKAKVTEKDIECFLKWHGGLNKTIEIKKSETSYR